MMPAGGDENKERWLATRTGSFGVVLVLFFAIILLGVRGQWGDQFGRRAFVATAISVLIFAGIMAATWRMNLDAYRREQKARVKAGAAEVYSYRVRIAWFTGFALTLLASIMGAAFLLGTFGQ